MTVLTVLGALLGQACIKNDKQADRQTDRQTYHHSCPSSTADVPAGGGLLKLMQQFMQQFHAYMHCECPNPSVTT
jgi:hypothetical protein